MLNKHIKRYSISDHQKMQVKNIMGYHYLWIRIGKIPNDDNTKCWWGCSLTSTLIHCWWKRKMAPATLEDSSAVSYKTRHILTIMILQLCSLVQIPKELITYIHTKSPTQMFIAALFTIAKTWKQPRCPSVDEQIHPDNRLQPWKDREEP